MTDIGFRLYLIFVASWFLHLTSWVPALAKIRFDMLLVLFLMVLAFLANRANSRLQKKDGVDRLLKILIIYIVVSLPFVEWPGSVIWRGFPNFIKAAVFYYFTIIFVTTEKRLKVFLGIFLFCQSFRIVEPVYLHITEGYWGSAAWMEGGDFMNRLSGGPHDVVNPNGLGFIINSIIPFFYFLASLSKFNIVLATSLLPVFIYALILTGSRSGIIAFTLVIIGIIYKSKNKALMIGFSMIGIVVIFTNISGEFQERYLSIVNSNTRHSATAQGRIDGLMGNLENIMARPIFGHGLGTSLEASFHLKGKPQLPHNLYEQLLLEIGGIGLIIFLFLMKSIVFNFIYINRMILNKQTKSVFLIKINDAMQVWLTMNILFSFVSYGLSSYLWYLFAGFSVVLSRLSSTDIQMEANGKDVSG